MILILIANLSLLAGSALPHHHHYDHICFQIDHNDKDHRDCHDDDTDNAGICTLNEPALLPAAPVTQQVQCFDFAVNINHDLQLPSFFDAEGIKPVSKLIFCIHSVSYWSFRVESSSGLRAPPVV